MIFESYFEKYGLDTNSAWSHVRRSKRSSLTIALIHSPLNRYFAQVDGFVFHLQIIE